MKCNAYCLRGQDIQQTQALQDRAHPLLNRLTTATGKNNRDRRKADAFFLPCFLWEDQMEQNEIRKEGYEKGGEITSAPMKQEYQVSFFFRKDKGKTLEQKIKEIILKNI